MTPDSIIAIAEASKVQFKLGDVTVPCLTALRSSMVARDVISIGDNSLDLASPGIAQSRNDITGDRLAAYLFDYALEVSPRVEGEENIIDVPKLGKHAEYLRELCNYIERPEFVRHIGLISQAIFDAEKFAPKLSDIQPGTEQES